MMPPGTPPDDPALGPAAVPVCPRHPGTPALVRCQRCRRPVCPACQVQAAVGVQCPECVRAGRRARPMLRSVFGAPLTRGAPVMTIGAIALCVAVFVGQIASGERLTQELILYPAGVWYQPWRLVTSAFLHGSVLHLAFNMYALWLVGGFVEQLVGRTRFATIYLASAIGGHAAVLTSYRVFDFPDFQAAYTGTLGASGAVFGLFAAAFVLSRRLGGNIRGIAVVIGVNLVFGFMVANISWQAHLGGLALGGALALVYAYAPPRRRRAYAWAAGIGAACLLAAVIAATASPWALGG